MPGEHRWPGSPSGRTCSKAAWPTTSASPGRAPREAEIAAAADAAGAADFIAALPGGFDTTLGENGQRLSGGQRQRIAIARAFLRDAPVVILDEPTAHLDPETEATVRDAIERLAEGRTVLLITHREQVSAIADSIVELGR